jgi:microcystin-dependent protein
MSPESYIGSISTFAGHYAPLGWMDCAGQTLSVSKYPALYSIISSTYGGDTTNFRLPDFRPELNGVKVDWAQVNQPRKCIAIEGIYPMRP